MIPYKLPSVKTILAIGSGKGGVGKTFLASNLTVMLAKMGIKVGLLDGDICYPNVYSMLGIKEHLAPTSDNKLIPLEKWGIKVISMAGLLEHADEPILWRGPIISKIIQKLLKESLWGELDMLIIDLPTGTTDVALTLFQQFSIDQLLLVTTPQKLALMDVERVIKSAQLLKIPLGGIVENMRGEIFGEGSVAHYAQKREVRFLGSIPLRKQIVSFSDQGIPPVFHMEELELIMGKLGRAILENIMV